MYLDTRAEHDYGGYVDGSLERGQLEADRLTLQYSAQ